MLTTDAVADRFHSYSESAIATYLRLPPQSPSATAKSSPMHGSSHRTDWVIT
ncbi:hypothetical protein V1460_13070 [Streptomyces sp. SCSIO 30461]|uniref:hypothetical protein n=1 Tax=Streptomyces sp. SCSIO 30461 TaxID=3118085 RepID=UPI0030CF208A